jgi:hypothetical protein
MYQSPPEKKGGKMEIEPKFKINTNMYIACYSHKEYLSLKNSKIIERESVAADMKKISTFVN